MYFLKIFSKLGTKIEAHALESTQIGHGAKIRKVILAH